MRVGSCVGRVGICLVRGVFRWKEIGAILSIAKTSGQRLCRRLLMHSDDVSMQQMFHITAFNSNFFGSKNKRAGRKPHPFTFNSHVAY